MKAIKLLVHFFLPIWIVFVIITIFISVTSQAIARDLISSAESGQGPSTRPPAAEDQSSDHRLPEQQSPKTPYPSNLKIGLALGSGGAKGLAHIGVLKALKEEGISIHAISGSSMGAIVGAAVASGIPIDTLEKIALQTDWKDLALLFDPAIPRTGLLNGEKVKKFLDDLYTIKCMDSLNIPLRVIAADITTGNEYIIETGDLATAVRTSISIPVLFNPQKYEDLYLVDGGLVNPVPIEAVRSLGVDFIIAVNVLVPSLKSTWRDEPIAIDADKISMLKDYRWTSNGESVNHLSYPSLFQITYKTVIISQAKLAQMQIELAEPDLLIEPKVGDYRAWEFKQAQDLIDLGYKAAKMALNEYRNAVPENPLFPNP